MLTDAERRAEAMRVRKLGYSEALESKFDAELVAADVREAGEPCEIRRWGAEWRVRLGPQDDPDPPRAA